MVAPAVLGGIALGAMSISVLWSNAIANDRVVGQLSEVGWLRAHVAFYLLGNALLIGTTALSAGFWFGNLSTRKPWLEMAVCGMAVAFAAGAYAGFQFTRPAWGFNPWTSDGKLITAVAAMAVTAVLLPLSIWLRVRVGPRRRHLVLTCCLLAVASLAALSFFYPVPSIHPNARLLPYS